MTRFLTVGLMLVACNGKDVPDPPLDTSPELPTVGSDVLQFRGQVPKNLLFLSVDTFRKDHHGAHGALGLTPFMTEIASQGVVMNDHVQCSNWTYGSTTCTLAGRTNVERGQLPRLNGNETNRTKVPDGTPFLATWLGQADYFSVLISANDWLGPSWGNSQGYTEFSRPGGNAYAVHDRGTAAVRSAIESGAEKWFMHLHFMEPHAAYNPPPNNLQGIEDLEPWPEDLTDRPVHYDSRDDWPTMPPEEQSLLEAHLRELYKGEIRTIDERFEDIWRDLEREGYLNDTLVVFWNDHGEQFWEHGNQTHAYTMFGEETDGFLVFWSRNIVPGRYSGPTSTIDLVPTILDLYDIEMPEEITGFPIGTAPAGRPIHAETLARRGAINTVAVDGWRMHYSWSGLVKVFDRNTDPGETVDLFDPEDPKTLELWGHLKPMAEAMAPLVVNGSPSPTFPSSLP
ncbi:MAG: sulfatase-like hydrolase/transferase [Myxococcales bacterium]|nr:sulfatase-like hydrolase/transferase [Myxococcales bacterium]